MVMHWDTFPSDLPAPAWRLDSSNPTRAPAAPPSLGCKLGVDGVRDLEGRQEDRIIVTAKGGHSGPHFWDRGLS